MFMRTFFFSCGYFSFVYNVIFPFILFFFESSCHFVPYYLVYFFLGFFFFKQKTAYEMRISDWSSDVCSSDLHARQAGAGIRRRSERRSRRNRAGPARQGHWPPRQDPAQGQGQLAERKPSSPGDQGTRARRSPPALRTDRKSVG